MGDRRIVNVCFHGIGVPLGPEREPGEHDYWIGTAEFHGMLDVIRARPDVRISFDDGNRSDTEIALDALRERGLTATFFVLAGRFSDPRSLSEADVVELHRAGMTIGTHGMDHVPWRGLDAEQQRRELVEAREIVARAAGTPVSEAALPLGRYDRRLLSELRRLGYSAVHTSDRRAARRGAWLQPRFSVRATDTAAMLHAEALSPQPLLVRLEASTKGVVKRLR